MQARRFSPKNYRQDHEDFGEVYKVTYKTGELLRAGASQLDPLTPSDAYDVKVKSGEFANVPVFYHCKEGYYNNRSGDLLANGALRHGSLAFDPEKHEAKIMFREANPEFIIGHEDGKPRHCLNIFRFQIQDWYRTKSQYSYLCTEQELYSDLGEPILDKKGKEIEFDTQEAIMLAGHAEIKFASVNYYLGDWLIHLGPMLFIWSVHAICLPLPFTGDIFMQAAPYSKELKEQAIAEGKEKESKFPTAIFSPVPMPREYKGFTRQTKFTNLLRSQFQGWKRPQPRWIFCKFFAQTWSY
ncbi:MAG: hypothetical protein ACOZF2_11285 [Thermodesulfobacteriota bacterium]